MCHRFNVKSDLRQIVEPFGAVQVHADSVPDADCYPMSNVLILRRDPDLNEWIIEFRQWGWLPSHWRPSEKYSTRKNYQRQRFNARSETAHSTWGFRRAFASQRCVVVGSCFYEPYRDGGEARYTTDSGLMYFAGLWDDWSNAEELVRSCTMLTTNANPLVAANRTGRLRQPVILTELDQVTRYCNPEISERAQFEDLLKPLSWDVMTIHRPE
ncbi:MAG: SOS response-associated peptidase [Fuerstiella sp.]|nr:SOS response-associated peptidase [Fuerstiella sp.]